MLKRKFFTIKLLLAVLVLLINSCSNQPEPINYGQDECDFCRMLITDNRYGCELITDKGKVYKFDEVGCMINYALVENLVGDTKQQFLVTVFTTPESFTDASKAFYVYNDEFRSPMGLNVVAFDRDISSKEFIGDNGGQPMTWIEVIELVKQSSM